MQTITPPTALPTQPDGVIVHTAINAGRLSMNHSEGVVVRSAASGRIITNHSEGVVVRSAVKACGHELNHSEGVAVRSSVKAGGVIAPQ